MRFFPWLALAACAPQDVEEGSVRPSDDSSAVLMSAQTPAPPSSPPAGQPMISGEARYAEGDCPRPGIDPGELIPLGGVVQAKRCVVGDPTVCYPADDRISLLETAAGTEAFIFTCSPGDGDVEYVITWMAPAP